MVNCGQARSLTDRLVDGQRVTVTTGGGGVRDTGGQSEKVREITGVFLNFPLDGNTMSGKGGLIKAVRWRLTLVSPSPTAMEKINSTSS